MTRRFRVTLDLKKEPAFITGQRNYRDKIWPNTTQSIHEPCIEDI
jgi:hypothetical protein